MNKENNNKHTIYFYLAIIVLVLALGVCYYQFSALNTTIDQYVQSGYTREEVLEYYPYSTLIPGFAETLCRFGIIAVVMFVADSMLNKMKALEGVAVLADLLAYSDEDCCCEDEECHCAECEAENNEEKCCCAECEDEGVVVASFDPAEEKVEAKEEAKAE